MPALTVLLAALSLGLLARGVRRRLVTTKRAHVSEPNDDGYDARLDHELALLDE